MDSGPVSFDGCLQTFDSIIVFVFSICNASQVSYYC